MDGRIPCPVWFITHHRSFPCVPQMDEKIPEPLGAAHTDPMAAFPAIRKAILDNWRTCVCLVL